MTRHRIDRSLLDVLRGVGSPRSAVSAPEGDGASPDGPSTFDPSDIPRLIVELCADWAFVARLDGDGRWEQEWLGGLLPGRSGAGRGREQDLDPGEWRSLVAVEDRPLALAHFAEAIRDGASRAELRMRPTGKAETWVESSIRAVPDASAPGTLRIFGTMRDVSDRRRAQEALERSESQYRALVEQASDGILVFDAQGRIHASNPAAYELFALSRHELHARRISELLHPDDLDRDPLALENLASGMTLRSVRRVMRGDDWIWAELSARRLPDGRVQATVRDITARIEAEQRIRNLAYYDALTGLPNRELFREQLDRGVERCREGDRQLALLFLDIDRFKQVNDSLGHSSGDVLLQQVAERLRTVLRGSDAISRGPGAPSRPAGGSGPVSRLGGDEFTILLPGLDHSQDAARVARRVLHALSRPYTVSGQEVFAGGSIGIAVWPDDGESSEGLLRAADTAMYHAKSRGGNVYEFFNESMNSTSARRLQLESGLRRALEKDEFHLVYQPIRDSRTGRVTAAEALIRWVDAEGRCVGPDEFIPIAEETGLIVEIGRWVVRTACHQMLRWRQAGFAPVRLSVNVSVCQLRLHGIAEFVDQVLFETGLSPRDLELEITETSILDAHPQITAAVSALAATGVGFALDDFGTGYSSLSALQRFPIERLKIDRSFVAGVGENESDETLTSAIVALAKRLGRKVVAEGVETEVQARFLQALGCDELQGYLFSPPVEAERFEAFLERDEKSGPARSLARPGGAG